MNTSQTQDPESQKRRERIEQLRKRIQQRKDEAAARQDTEANEEKTASSVSSEDEEEVIEAKILDPKTQNLVFERGIGEINVRANSDERYDQEVQAVSYEPAVEITRNVCQHCETNIEKIETRRKGVVVCDEVKKNKEEISKKVLDEFSKEEVRSLVQSTDFCEFLDKSSKIMEKTLDLGTVNIFEDLLQDGNKNYKYQEEKEFYEVQTFHDKQLTSNRVVTSIDWSPNLSELFLASYSQNFEGNPNDPQGVLLLWSLQLRSRPEFTCYCQSQITVAKFNQHSSSIVVGGTYSGQVIIWDLRAKSTPVHKSGSVGGPIYSLDIVGTQNSQNIISLSNDGRLCVWDTKMLSTPQKEIDLKVKRPQDMINSTCLCFPNQSANNFFTGTEDGRIYSGQVHCRPDENIIESFTGHQGPITSLSAMPSFKDLTPQASKLLLSSSYDWTVKLWYPKLQSKPIWSFESAEDYVYDVAWSPTNPTLFASVDRDGYIDLWDLSKDLEVPYLHHKGDTRALNKLAWNRDGSRLLTGSAGGDLKLYGLEKNLQEASEESLNRFEAQILNLINS